MSEMSAEQQQAPPLDEEKVIRYLQHNPEVLLAYPEVFSTLSIPHQTDGATSLVIDLRSMTLRASEGGAQLDDNELAGVVDSLVDSYDASRKNYARRRKEKTTPDVERARRRKSTLAISATLEGVVEIAEWNNVGN